jgi:hypothetical protein
VGENREVDKIICLELGYKRYLLEQFWKVEKYIPKVCRKTCTVNNYGICDVMVNLKQKKKLSAQSCGYL